MDTPAPLFRALATSTRPIYQLLRCISFSNKVHVEISGDGIKFIADNARVMQEESTGMASLGKSLFASFSLNLPKPGGRNGDDGDEDDSDPLPATFQISLPALLEAIQIFGVTDAPSGRQSKSDPDTYRSNMRTADAFSHQILGMPGTCCLSYPEEGAPFGIILEEASVKTTCNLATYVPESLEAIPFDRDDLLFKIIMQPRWLLDALVELAPSSPNLLTIAVTQREPYLRLSSHGPLGSSSVDFSRGRSLFESIWVGERWAQSYKFDMIKSATEAMRIASKVSIRGDRQGVLSLQFMVEMDHAGGGMGTGAGSIGVAGGMQWLHFTFVPYITDEEDDPEAEGVEEAEEGDDEDDEL
ncbi:DNA repair protein [Grosmannia clavigera kw1407]|uniref:DNA repair protein n=1 Tax=Grosmannia clavigera (strain kw1407 / UAMH 11150) TaxID=655863 RepID=F0XN59_GROCL|nr:DNA repair protein [Grosmannia clavigera kw1407]EFX00916.1 DNA repair protein [Grosmannia clavigera kw1407]